MWTLFPSYYFLLLLHQHTPLMLACTKGRPEVVKVLLQYGADVTQREKEMETAPGHEPEEQETLNSLELAIENGRRYVGTCTCQGNVAHNNSVK